MSTYYQHWSGTAAFFQKRPVFALNDLATGLGLSESQALERAKYHLKRGRLTTIERGLYAVVPPGVAARAFQPDRYLVASAARTDSIFSHHAALELLGAAHSDWNVCTVLTSRRRRRLQVGSVQIQFLPHPKALVDKRLEQLGTRQVEREATMLRVTSPERTLADGFRQPRLVGGLPELVESAAGFGVLDLDLLKRILDAYDRKALWAATGWFLERYQKTFFVPEQYLAALEKKKPRSPQYLPPGERPGTLVQRWNLVLPTSVVRGGEPDET
jgi:predicted transcriptional regulator of viral defense system